MHIININNKFITTLVISWNNIFVALIKKKLELMVYFGIQKNKRFDVP